MTESTNDLLGMWEAADLSGGWADVENEKPVAEPGFYPEWYNLGVRSQEVAEDGGDIGNRAYMDWIERVIFATGRIKVDWTQISLAVILDREVRADEARRTSDRAQAASEGVDMLIAQAERQAAVKALREQAAWFLRSGYSAAGMKTKRRAAAIENGSDF